MVTLASPVARDLILATHIANTTGYLLGTSGYGQLGRFNDISDSTNYSVIIGNQDATNGRALHVTYGPTATATTIATFAKSAISLDVLTAFKHADLTNPAASYTGIGARASDGRPVYYINGGSQLVLANTSEVPSGILTTTGDMIYSSSGSTPARRGIGTTGQTLTVVGGVPAWANGALAVVTTAGDLVYGTGANAIARLGIGTARQQLATNAGATAPEWVASLQSLMTGTGDLVVSSGANTPARLAIGTARQQLAVNSGATGLEYVASLQSLMTAQGDLLYASAANTPVRLAKGTAGQALVMNAGATAPEWATNTATRNVTGSAVGSASGPTTTSTTFVDLTDMSVTVTTTGGDLIVWFSGAFANDTLGATILIGASLDGAAEVGIIAVSAYVANYVIPISTVFRFAAPSSASHTVKIRWRVDSGTGTGNGTNRSMVLMET